MWDSVSGLGQALLLINLVVVALSVSLGLSSVRRPELLDAARRATYGSVALLGSTTALLAYAFVAHDFRISYVTRYSDRSMPLFYLLSSLWGGQDGSILWWMMSLGAYTAAVLRWMRGRYLRLQPYVIATTMTVMFFFAIVAVFAANPFAEHITSTPIDGQGLNPLLQTVYMAVHPPALYLGFVGCTIPFAFAVAALIRGKLDDKWILAIRKWMLFAWVFLTIGNALGMLWAYVELGWGGYWGWDPVENASLLPWLTSTAYIHSTMVQERRPTFRKWNVVLIFLTFFLTIFGTFLTRSGAISSVHAFSKSTMGDYFVWFLVLLAVASVGLVIWRRDMLVSEYSIRDYVSKEGVLLGANVTLIVTTLFVGVATVFPMITEAFSGETVSVGPEFYNRWIVPIGLTIFALMAVAPLVAWGRTNRLSFRKSMSLPLAVSVIVATIHAAFGAPRGLPALIDTSPMIHGGVPAFLRAFLRMAPLLTTFLVTFAVVVVTQEVIRAVSTRSKKKSVSWTSSFVTLVGKSRRRYGGYLAHVGVGMLFLGFLGQAWTVNSETSLSPGQSYVLSGYTLQYIGPRQEEDTNKQMTFADLQVTDRWGADRGTLSPAKFVYRNHPEEPTSEIAVLHSFRDDLYVVLGAIDPRTGRASLQLHVNPMVSWIWAGTLALLLGALLSLWPSRAGVAAIIETTVSAPGRALRWRWLERLAAIPSGWWWFGLLAAAISVSLWQPLQIAVLLVGGVLFLLATSTLWSSLQIAAGDRPADPSSFLPSVAGAEYEEKAFIVSALDDLDMDHAVGKMSVEAFDVLSEQITRRAKSIIESQQPSEEDLVQAWTEANEYLKREGLQPLANPWDEANHVADDAGNPSSRGDSEFHQDRRPEETDRRPVCPSCGVSNEPDAKFCKSCGQLLNEPVPADDEGGVS